MVTIASGGLGGGSQVVDILKRIGMRRNAAAAPPAMSAGAPTASPVPMVSAVDTLAKVPAQSSGQVLPELSAVQPTAPKMGVFDRIGDFVESDRGRAALLRSGAETMRNGLGAGIAAGAAYYDDQKAIEQKQMNWVSEMGLRTRQTDIDQQTADQTGAYQAGRLDVDSTEAAIAAANAREAARKNRATENIDLVEEEGRNTRFGIGDSTQRRGQDITVRGQDVSMRNTDVNAETSRYGTDSTRYTADENRAAAYGGKGVATTKLPSGGTLKVERNAPDYGEIRYDAQGNAYRLDSFTGKPVRVSR